MSLEIRTQADHFYDMQFTDTPPTVWCRLYPISFGNLSLVRLHSRKQADFSKCSGQFVFVFGKTVQADFIGQ